MSKRLQAKMVLPTLLMLLVLQTIDGQIIQQTVVEDLSTNIDIICNLDRQLHPLYWNITGKVYELYSVPAIFTTTSPEAITLASVNRRMNGWILFCFSVGVGVGHSVIAGATTVLHVIYEVSGQSDSSGDDLLQPSLHERLGLNLQGLQFGTDTVTLVWLYSPEHASPCARSEYQVAVYSHETISAESQSELTPFYTTETAEKRITINSNILRNNTSNTNFVRIFAVRNCATSAYFYDLDGVVPQVIHVSESSASIVIPEDLRNNRSVQLIWSKDVNIQCVCPPMEEFISQCACNINNPDSNMVTISNYHLTISNLTQLIGEEDLMVYFVSSISSGCRGTCNLRSIVGAYRINFKQGYPQPPNIIHHSSNSTFCFNILNNPISLEVYEVNLTDSTGSLTRLSGIYNTSQCLTITSDLYPDVCGPFPLSVAATNTVGREVTQLTINTSNEASPCDCYLEKENFQVEITNITPTSAGLMLTCEYRDSNFAMNFIIFQIENISVALNVTIPCNSMKVVNFLTPLTNYSVLAGGRLQCSLTNFLTDQANINGKENLILIISISTLSIFVVFLSVLILIFCVCCYSNKNSL